MDWHLRVDRVDAEDPRLGLDGILRAQAQIARAGPLTYQEGGKEIIEFRPPELAQRLVQQTKGLPITYDHPAGMVVPENKESLTCGLTEQGSYGQGWLSAPINIVSDKAIQGLLGSYNQFSLGYWAAVSDEPGQWTDEQGICGEPGTVYNYDRIRTDEELNHLAIVQAARAGEGATLLPVGDGQPQPALDARFDGTPSLQGIEMPTKEIKLDINMDNLSVLDMGGKVYPVERNLGEALKAGEVKLYAMADGRDMYSDMTFKDMSAKDMERDEMAMHDMGSGRKYAMAKSLKDLLDGGQMKLRSAQDMDVQQLAQALQQAMQQGGMQGQEGQQQNQQPDQNQLQQLLQQLVQQQGGEGSKSDQPVEATEGEAKGDSEQPTPEEKAQQMLKDAQAGWKVASPYLRADAEFEPTKPAVEYKRDAIKAHLGDRLDAQARKQRGLSDAEIDKFDAAAVEAQFAVLDAMAPAEAETQDSSNAESRDDGQAPDKLAELNKPAPKPSGSNKGITLPQHRSVTQL